jgi:hypothetical protein
MEEAYRIISPKPSILFRFNHNRSGLPSFLGVTDKRLLTLSTKSILGSRSHLAIFLCNLSRHIVLRHSEPRPFCETKRQPNKKKPIPKRQGNLQSLPFLFLAFIKNSARLREDYVSTSKGLVRFIHGLMELIHSIVETRPYFFAQVRSSFHCHGSHPLPPHRLQGFGSPGLSLWMISFFMQLLCLSCQRSDKTSTLGFRPSPLVSEKEASAPQEHFNCIRNTLMARSIIHRKRNFLDSFIQTFRE